MGTIASDYYVHPTEPLRHRREVRWQGRVSRAELPAGFWAGKVAALAEIDAADIPPPG